MMKKLLPILTAILLAFGSNGQAPAPYPILVDSQRDTVAGLQVFQANQITFRASYRSGNATNNLVAVTPFMYWLPYGPTNATVVTGRWTIVSASSGTVDFAFTPADLNFATGTYTYQIGLNVSGGPNVIKQGSFIIKASQASIGASPIAFATTNVNWGAINWSGLPAYEYQTNTIAISNALNSQIASVSNALNTAIANTSNALNTRVTANETGKVAKAGDTMTGNLSFTNAGLTSLDFATFDTAPTGAISQARMQWQSGRQTLRLGLNANVNLDVGQQVILYARNEETNTLSKGEVVFVAGANGDNPTIKRASNASESLSARTIGITAEDITVNASGHVVTKGTVYGLNTTNFTQGANLYLGANGTVQTNLPAAPLHGVFVGVVERVHPNAGQIYVAIQNYQELRELSDVFVNGVANNDLIVYNAASSRWQNATLASLGISTSAGITVESDPIFVAASNSFYLRSNPSNFITTAALSGYATGTPLYVETDPTALTNVTASGRIAATPSGKQVALTFDASGLATGTPIYSVSGLATGTPLYAFTETDTIATNRLTNYYTITAADAKFATGTPLYVESAFNANSNRITALEGYTNRAASALSSSVWASANSTTNFMPRTGGIFTSAIGFDEGSESDSVISNVFRISGDSYGRSIEFEDGSLNGSYLFSSNVIFQNKIEMYKVLNQESGIYLSENSSGTLFNVSITATGGLRVGVASFRADVAGNISQDSTNTAALGIVTATSFSGNHIGNAASLTNFPSLLATTTSLAAATADIATLQTYTSRAASALASSVWASADSTTNYASRVTFGSFTSSYATADATTNYASRITFNATSNSFNSRISNVATGAVYVTNLSAIAGSGLSVISNQLTVSEANVTNYLPLSGGTIRNNGTILFTNNISSAQKTSIAIGGSNNQIIMTNHFTSTDSIAITLAATTGQTGLDINDASSVGGTFVDFKRNGTNEYLFGFTDANFGGNNITNAVIYGNGVGITNIQSGALPNLSGTYLLLSTYVNDTNRLQIQSGSVTQGQSGTFGTSYISGTNYWISLGSTNWVKFEGKLNSF